METTAKQSASIESSEQSSIGFSRILWVGRLTGPKGEIAKTLAFDIAPQFPQLQFSFVGGPSLPGTWPSIPDNVEFVGQVSDVTTYYQQADLVIGAGRVALEAMKLQRPVMAVGECCYVGLIDRQTIRQGKATNFGDCFSPAEIDWSALAQDLSALASGERTLSTGGYSEFLQDYEPVVVHAAVRETYRQAMAEASLRSFSEVPVLMYHQVPEQAPEGSVHCVYTVKEQLREQLANLKKRGYETLTFRDLAAGKRVKKPIILTFDDGYADNYHNLLPLLEEFDYSAVIFALADDSLTRNEWDIPAGEPPADLMTVEQLQACHQSGRIEIASHGLRHRHLPELSTEELTEELQESKRRLEQWLGDEVISFAYPYGDYGDREVEAARQAGYLFALATVSGPLHLADDLYRIRRINIMHKDRGIKFWKKTSGWYLRYCRWKGKDF